MAKSEITKILGRVIPLRGDDIDTDRIVPARYLRCVTFDGLGDHVFKDDRKQDTAHPFNQMCYQGASILLVGKNFGCGSSREHAPQALNKWGINGIIGYSFAEIFFANCQAMGIPCFTIDDEASQILFASVEEDPSRQITLDIRTATIHYDQGMLPAQIPSGVQTSFLEGTWNATQVLLEAGEKIDSLAAHLPYLNDFRYR